MHRRSVAWSVDVSRVLRAVRFFFSFLSLGLVFLEFRQCVVSVERDPVGVDCWVIGIICLGVDGRLSTGSDYCDMVRGL